jgi:cysteinyl-tRNA synthetase
MPLRFHNTLTRRVEEFHPANPPRVTVYACGPTVYGHAHIGNWSSFLFFDVVVRWLKQRGYQVRFVTNVTDVDDKTIRDSIKGGETLEAFTRRWEKAYLDGRKTCGCVEADAYPRATEHVEGMQRMIQALLDRGHAYVADDGVYFRVASFPHYGELANLSKETVKAGASGRVAADEYEKEAVGDFALWKVYDPASDGAVFWEPTFAVDGQARPMKGRPGWHIECSVMIQALLGDQIDIHLGGEDLKFPHHQNELAQSEAASGKRPFVRVWIHRRHLLVDGAKMSKSKQNFYTVADLVERAGANGPRAFRYMVASAHYGTPIDFSWAGLEAAAATLRNLTDARARLAKAAGGAAPATTGPAADARTAFGERMDDDLDTPGAMAAVHGFIHEANKALAAGTLAPAEAAAGVALLDLADAALGLSLVPTRTLSADEQALVDARMAARRARNFAEADRLRGVLAARGILVKDTKDGQDLTFS